MKLTEKANDVPATVAESFDGDDDENELPTIQLHSIHVEQETRTGLPNAQSVSDQEALDYTLALAVEEEEFEQSAQYTPVDEETATTPGFISVTFRKEIGKHVGLEFSNAALVESVDPTSPLVNSPIRVGYKMLSINDQSCAEMNKRKIRRYLKYSEGNVTLKFQNLEGNSSVVECMMSKNASPGEEHGILLRDEFSNRQSVCVAQIAAEGRDDGGTLLNVGDLVLSINGISCRELYADACMDIIDSSDGFYTILASSRAGLVVADLGTTFRSDSRYGKLPAGYNCKRFILLGSCLAATVLFFL